MFILRGIGPIIIIDSPASGANEIAAGFRENVCDTVILVDHTQLAKYNGGHMQADWCGDATATKRVIGALVINV